MGLHLAVRARSQRHAVPVRDDARVLAADWADATLSLELAQSRYRAALGDRAEAASLAHATAELMRARTRLEALRRAMGAQELQPAG